MRHAIEFFRKTSPTLRLPASRDVAEIGALSRGNSAPGDTAMVPGLNGSDPFRDTSIVAELDGRITGYVSAYVLPYDPETLFVWQASVAQVAGGAGLGALMLNSLLHRPACDTVTRVQTVITSDDTAAWALFREFAQWRDTGLDVQAYYTQALQFRARHSTEHVVTMDIAGNLSNAA